METKAGAIRIRMVSAMQSISRTFLSLFHVPPFRLPLARRGNLGEIAQRRRQATIDLSHASPHLRRDIGIVEVCFLVRRR